MKPAGAGGARLPLSRLFDTANARVMDHLLVNEGLVYTEAEISDLAAVPPRVLRRSLETLLDERMIKRSKKKGAHYYTADLSSRRTADLLSYIDSAIADTLDSLARAARK